MADTNTSLIPPDFIIAGLPKSGTTAIHDSLSHHPNICFSNPKETFFFNPEMKKSLEFSSREAYQRVHKDAAPEQLRGDGSVWSIFSESFPNNALNWNPKIKIIVLYREPISLVRSLFYYNLEKGYEDQDSIEAALEKEGARSIGIDVPEHCPDKKYLMYKSVAEYPKLVESLRRDVPSGQLLVLNPFELGFGDAVNKVIEFLNLNAVNLPELDSNRTSYSSSRGALFMLRNLRIIRKKFNSSVLPIPSTGIGRLARTFIQQDKTKPDSEKFLKDALMEQVNSYNEFFGKT